MGTIQGLDESFGLSAPFGILQGKSVADESWMSAHPERLEALPRLEATLESLCSTNESLLGLLRDGRAYERGAVTELELARLVRLFVAQKSNVDGYRSVLRQLEGVSLPDPYRLTVDRSIDFIRRIERSTDDVLRLVRTTLSQDAGLKS